MSISQDLTGGYFYQHFYILKTIIRCCFFKFSHFICVISFFFFIFAIDFMNIIY